MVKNTYFNLSAQDLSSLLCSRICHDIISPVGAIQNSLELLDEEGFEDEAMQLINLSVMNAIARLKLARIAFGYFGSADYLFEIKDIKEIIREFISIDNRVKVTWLGETGSISKQKTKLLLNLFMISYASIPRGGDLTIFIKDSISNELFSFQIKGVTVRFPEKFVRMIAGEMDSQIDSYDVQFYYTALLAHESDIILSYKMIDDHNITLSAAKNSLIDMFH